MNRFKIEVLVAASKCEVEQRLKLRFLLEEQRRLRVDEIYLQEKTKNVNPQQQKLSVTDIESALWVEAQLNDLYTP